ncbi:MAG: hypothetical protein GF355_14780, partial [Candidatus Eisenbacteria bacterium]|nr:hypothetical protein [Candidatus Eisenbacteria bacterium]
MHKHLSSRILITGGLVLAGLLAAALSHAEPKYPKSALYVYRLGDKTPADRQLAARHDLICTSFDPPHIIDEIRQNNPDVRLFFRWNPFCSIDYSKDETWWHADTTWSIMRLVQFYAERNDWYMKTTEGERIPAWNGWFMNWTPYCPEGTYGTAKGLTFNEWLAQVAMPQVMRDSPDWEPWGFGSSAYDGIHYELLVDCVGSVAGAMPGVEIADPDQDGLPEGVHDPCTAGGSEDSLSVLMRATNEQFIQDFYDSFGEDLPFIMNMNIPAMGPSWVDHSWGIKMERWLNGWQDWWDLFYGARDWSGTELWGPGYQYVEDYFRQEPDHLTGWDMTFIQVYMKPGWSQHRRDRMRRFGLGTS